mmetsp:Transcript_24664/g.32190  ORF Transcript_24664/g.32190 Transcript_24664/m.32190 type:complete len:87 (-) Transcript_24664:316-576(-)
MSILFQDNVEVLRNFTAKNDHFPPLLSSLTVEYSITFQSKKVAKISFLLMRKATTWPGKKPTSLSNSCLQDALVPYLALCYHSLKI